MSWKREWAKCDHPRHDRENAKYDDRNGEQDGWTCRSCGYHECKYCGDPSYSRCPNPKCPAP